ncbi:MAG: lysophospholipid acyltransferase family protein [Deltaproteobacteria bacterium]|nr:lysophospholipid acyltransferase family protein [Deltaproteobacteria bacterium]
MSPERSWVGRVLAWLAYAVLRLLTATYRVRLVGPSEGDGPNVYAFFHGRQLALFRYPRRTRMAVLSSLSRDGRLQARILSHLGFTVLDGSSSRGGARGLAAMIRCVRRGLDAAFAVDGPKGPYGIPKAGALSVARRSGAALVPITVGASRASVLTRAWDRYLVPWPFARVVIVRGEPVHIAKDACDEVLERERARLGDTLAMLTEDADVAARGCAPSRSIAPVERDAL